MSVMPQPNVTPDRGFWQRVAMMPFVPIIWREARRMSLGRIVGPMIVVAAVIHLGLGGYRAAGFESWVRKTAPDYDRNYDPTVFENGTVRVEGARLPRYEDSERTILVDPEEAVPISQIKTAEYIVVRRDVLIQKRAMRPVQQIKLSDLAELLGRGPIVIRSDTILSWWERNRFWVQVGVTVFLGFFGLVIDGIACPLFALPAAGLVFALRGRALGGTFAEYFRVALASSTATIVIELMLNLLGTNVGACLGILVWPALIAVLSLTALGGDNG